MPGDGEVPYHLDVPMTTEHLWVGIGLFGEAQFGARFILQWIASERQKKTVVPHGFWYLSIGGGITLLAYAIYRLDPIFILGEAFGLLVFLRNLHFIRRAIRRRAGGWRAPGKAHRPPPL